MEGASITIAQALLLGFFWWFKTNYYGQTFTCFISNSCLTAALFVGIVLGDVPNAMIIGASIQLIYLGILGPGGNLPQDPVLLQRILFDAIICRIRKIKTSHF